MKEEVLMLHRKIIITVIFAILIGLFTLGSFSSCRNGNAIAPDPEDQLPTPDISDDKEIPVTPDTTDLDILEPDEASTQSFDDLPEALDTLRYGGGGVTTIELDEGIFVLNCYDATTLNPLVCQLLIRSGDAPGTLWDINGCGIFQNAINPLIISAYADGYALSTIVGTSANIISIPLRQIDKPQDATVFGVAETYGYGKMYFYNDSLLPEGMLQSPTSPDGNFMSYELPFDPYVVNGFSAFLSGDLQLPEEGDGYAVMGLAPLTLARHFSWTIPPLNPGVRFFQGVNFYLDLPPAGIVTGQVGLPDEYCGEMAHKLDGARIWALPTAILLEGERYLAVGPHEVLEGEDPTKLDYSCKWFAPEIAEDRLVLAAQFELADGSADIVHATWHGTETLDPIQLSGFPEISISDYEEGAGFSYPQFGLVNPLGENSCLYKIYANADGMGPVWEITLAGGSDFVDSSIYDIPITWLRELLRHPNVDFRLECIDAMDQSIDEFTKHDVILRRNEVAFSAWTDHAE